MHNPLWHAAHAINCRGRLLDLSTPLVMGILNATPDSFYESSRVKSSHELIDKAGKMLDAGATLLDLGGASTRPGATLIESHVEIDRVMPMVEKLIAAFPEAIISLDTYNSTVARLAIQQGVSMINDISGGRIDNEMWNVVASSNTPYVLSHIQGDPSTMQVLPIYNDVLTEVADEFIKAIHALRNLGLHDIILDVGFGFGKTLHHNYTLLKSLHQFRFLGCPMMAGLSRKSMVWKISGGDSEGALNGTSSLHMIALGQGVKILRVHDVKEALECIRIYNYLRTIDPKIDPFQEN